MCGSQPSSKVVASLRFALILLALTVVLVLRMVDGPRTTNKSHSTNLMRTRVTRIPIHEAWTLQRDSFRTTPWRTTFIRCSIANYRQKQSLKYCAYILMKVHTLDIDSGERDTNVYAHANNYVVTLKEPIYDVTKVTLVSARIPTPQLTICSTNKTFSIYDSGAPD